MPKSSASTKPCSLNMRRTCNTLGQVFLSKSMLCPITPYPASTTPSTAKTRGHPNTKTPQTVAARMIPLFNNSCIKFKLVSETAFLSLKPSLLPSKHLNRVLPSNLASAPKLETCRAEKVDGPTQLETKGNEYLLFLPKKLIGMLFRRFSCAV